MRLIDADKLKFVPAMIEPILVGDEPHWETIILKDRIDAAPTVGAVPVDWIAEYLRTADDNADSVISEMMRRYYDMHQS